MKNTGAQNGTGKPTAGLVSYSSITPTGVSVTWLLCYFVNKLTFRGDFKHIWFLQQML